MALRSRCSEALQNFSSARMLVQLLQRFSSSGSSSKSGFTPATGILVELQMTFSLK